MTDVAEKRVDVHEPGPGQDALPAHAPLCARAATEELDFAARSGGEVGVPRLQIASGCAPGPEEHGLAEPGARGDHRLLPVALGLALEQRRRVPAPSASSPQAFASRSLRSNPTAGSARRAASAVASTPPGEVGQDRRRPDDRAGHADRGGDERDLAAAEELVDDRLEGGERAAPEHLEADEPQRRPPIEQREARLRPAHVSGQDHGSSGARGSFRHSGFTQRRSSRASSSSAARGPHEPAS